MPADIRHTTCVLDCPDACQLEVEVRDGRIARIGGSREHPDTAGFICSKVGNFDRRVYHADRLLHPMRRVGPKGDGGFERISWDEALDTIAENLRAIRQRWGGEAILPFHYGGSNGMLSDGLVDDLFFARLGASRLAKTICAVPATEVAVGMYGKMPGVAFADFVEAKCIVVWGANPKGSNIHLVPYLKEAKRRGAFLATIDPKRNFSDREVDLHLPVLPGQDLPLALAMIARWERQGRLDREFLAAHAVGVEPLLERARGWTVPAAAEVAGLDPAAVELLADRIAASDPAIIRCGWGLERNRNGAQAIAAVLAIPALLGKFGRRGGGYTLSNNGAVRFDRTAVVGPLDWRTRALNMTQLGRLLAGRAPKPPRAASGEAPGHRSEDRSPEGGPPVAPHGAGATAGRLAGGRSAASAATASAPSAGGNGRLDPPIRGLFVYNANPAATVPDQRAVLEGLAREDLFTVVHEQVMTDTARFADILLPAPTFLEAHDLRAGYGSYVVGGTVPVVAPQGEARSNMRLFADLARRMGFDDEAFGWDDETLLRRAAAAIAMPGGAPDPDLLARGRQRRYDFPGERPVQFETVFPRTADGKIHLTPEVLGPEPFRWRSPANGAPLALISPASPHLITSMMGEYNLDVLRVTLHPDDAAARGLGNGERVRVFNGQGEVVCELRVSDAVRPGVAHLPKGAWRRSSVNGATSTALCPDDAQVVGDAACFNDARVDVARAV